MKSSKLYNWLRAWDRDQFDLDRATYENLQDRVPTQPQEDRTWEKQRLPRLTDRQYRLFGRLYPYMAALLSAVMILFLLLAVAELPAFGSAQSPTGRGEVMRRYVTEGVRETGAVNLVAGIILDYRAFDTLGESHVLFTALVAVLILLLQDKEEKEKHKAKRILEGDPVLFVTARVLFPLILLFGVYVILNGHLGPGGGFCGGAIAGAALILYHLAFGAERLGQALNWKTFFRLVLAALLFYSLAKGYAFFCGANGLETVFTTGTPGALFSAGLILPLNIAIGLVVACTMYGLYSVFTRGKI